MNYKEYLNKIKSRNDNLIEKLNSDKEETINFDGYELIIKPKVFNPSLGEGSQIMSKFKHLFIGDVLEIGTGSGILSILAAEIADKVIATDISPDAVKCAEENILKCGVKEKIKVMQGDLFLPITKSEKFDTILFNPPFLYKNKPTQEGIEKTYFDTNYSVLDTFIKNAKNFLKEDGCIYICFGGVGDIGYLNYLIALHEYKVQILEFKKIDELCYFVYELSNS